jgi:hypothetical protein
MEQPGTLQALGNCWEWEAKKTFTAEVAPERGSDLNDNPYSVRCEYRDTAVRGDDPAELKL